MKKNYKIVSFFKTPIISFILLIIGTIGQSIHTYHVALLLSPLDGILKYGNAVLLAIFFSAGLVYFSVKLGISKTIYQNAKKYYKYQQNNKKEILHPVIKKYIQAVIIFQIFETLINIFYWSMELLYKNGKFYFEQSFLFIGALMLSILLPAILRFYAGEIKNESNNIIDGNYTLEMNINEKTIKYKNVKILQNDTNKNSK